MLHPRLKCESISHAIWNLQLTVSGMRSFTITRRHQFISSEVYGSISVTSLHLPVRFTPLNATDPLVRSFIMQRWFCYVPILCNFILGNLTVISRSMRCLASASFWTIVFTKAPNISSAAAVSRSLTKSLKYSTEHIVTSAA